MSWTIRSYVGVDNLRFGLSPAEIAGILGKPEDADDEGAGRLSEYRALHEPIVRYRDNKVSELTFSKEATEVMFQGIDLLGSDQTAVLRNLAAIASDLVELKGGGIASLQLGLSLSGFQDPDDSNKSVNAFERGLFDKHMPGARPVRL